ncbi:MAG: GNAT family N-acetyltransferase [Chitinophagaceae bacterium]
MEIIEYNATYEQAVIQLILNIQQHEFGVPVTIADQPDLLDVRNFYCKGYGNFWLALDDKKLIGSSALIDIGNRQAALRKMFVHADYRGKETRTGQQLMDHIIAWCHAHGIDEIYLGTFETLLAAQRFYIKNGFVQVTKQSLPASFPLMQVDNVFFKLVVQR